MNILEKLTIMHIIIYIIITYLPIIIIFVIICFYKLTRSYDVSWHPVMLNWVS